MVVAPEIVTRREAKALGLVRYCTGEPCKHGHIAERLTSNWTCVVCNSLHVIKYERDTRGTAGHRERDKRRNSSIAAKAYRARYRASDKGKEAGKRARSSPAKKQWWAEYKKTEKYRQARERGKVSENAWRASDRGKAITKATRVRRYRENIQHRLREVLRSRFRAAIKNNAKTGSAVRDLGCSIDEFKAHIESMFVAGMSWENWARTGWHLDHKKPLAKFDLTEREQLLLACHYSNYQPLWAADNHRKSAKYTIEEQS